MNKNILILSFIMFFIFISGVSGSEINETIHTENENNYNITYNYENEIKLNNNADYNLNQDFQKVTNKFIMSTNNTNLIFKDISNQKNFINEDECFDIILNKNLKNNSNYGLYYGTDILTNKSYLIVNEIQSNINQENSVLTGHNTAFFYKNGKYSVYLKDTYGNPLNNERIIFNINGVGYNRVTDNNGYAYMNINLRPGNYTITTLFAGSNQYKSSTIINSIYIISTIYSNNLIKSYKNDSQFTAMVFDGNGNRLKNSVVTFNINGVFYNKTTDKTGVAQLNINLDPGKYIITITNNNDKLSESYNLTVLKQNIIIKYDNFVINRKGEYFITKVTDPSGKPLTNFNINIIANGVSYTKTSDTQGIAKLKISFETGNYNIYCTFPGTYQYNSFNGLNKIITMLPTSTKLNVNLNTNNTIFRDKGYSFNAVLKDNNGLPMSGKTIIFKINGISYSKTTDENGIAKQNINLNPGQYSISTTYADSTYYNSITKNNIIKMNLTPNMVYSVDIPMYFNVSGLDFVYPNYSFNYVSKAGTNGIIKVYETRSFAIKTTGEVFGFKYGANSDVLYNNSYTQLSNGDNYFISKECQKTKVNNNYIPSSQGILLKTEKDFVRFYYYDTINENNINEFSAIYSTIINSNFDIQKIDFVKNFNSWGNILYSNSIFNDDIGLRLQLSQGKTIWNGANIAHITYKQFLNNNLSKLKYTNTNTTLKYTYDYSLINKNPDFEYMNTIFKINNELIEKTEKINTGVLIDAQAGFNTIQTYTITDRKTSNDDIKYWLNKNYSHGPEKATYGTFLNGLMTIYMSDNLANEKDDFYNLTWTRNKNTVVMSGIMNGGMSYIHIPNPSMNMILSSNNNKNMKNFRFECSIMLSDIESMILKLADNITIFGSLSSLINHICNEEWFRTEKINDSLHLKFLNFSEKLIINQTTGIVSTTIENEGFLYKGALSTTYSYCFCDELTDNLLNNTYSLLSYITEHTITEVTNRYNDFKSFFGLSDKQCGELAEIGGGLCISISKIAAGIAIPCILAPPLWPLATVPTVIAVSFGLMGLGLNCLSTDTLRHPTWGNFNKAVQKTTANYLFEIAEVPVY